MRIATVLSIGLGVLTAGAAIALAVFSAVCTNCGRVPTHTVPPPSTPGLTPSSTGPSPQATDDPSARLTRALLTRFGSARIAEPARTGTYASLAGVPLPGNAVGAALSGRTAVRPRGCGVFPPAGWARTAASAPAARVTLTVGRHGTRLRAILLAPRTRPAGLAVPARCRAFTLPGGVPARSAVLRPRGVGDAARGLLTQVGSPGAPGQALLYTIVFRVGKVYGVVHVARTGASPSAATVRRAAHLYAERAATRARGLL